MRTLLEENKEVNQINDKNEHRKNKSSYRQSNRNEDVDVLDKDYFDCSDITEDDIKESRYDEVESSYYEYTESELKDTEIKEKEILPDYYEVEKSNSSSDDHIDKTFEADTNDNHGRDLENNTDLAKYEDYDSKENIEEDEEVELSNSNDEIYNDIKEINDDISRDNYLFKDTSDKRNENELLKEFSEKFQQENWESLSLEERVEAINNFAEYQTEKLGIKSDPSIEYYESEEENDFGGYQPWRNTICINKNNIEDAKETMDTIAHEYRHAFQFERASNPETEQDYIFRENFENYVCPDIDYRAYIEQEVERDAREYAGKYPSLIDNQSEESIERIINLNNDEVNNIDDYEFYSKLDYPIDNDIELPYDLSKLDDKKNDIEDINSHEIISSLRNLERNEQEGGHLIDRHIGKTDRELINRGTRETSTFYDLETVNEVINEILNNEEQYNRIKEWIEDEDRDKKLEIDYEGDNSKPLGNLITRNNGQYEKREVYNARFVLRSDRLENGNTKFFVLTGFPRR